jgi:hypothetical protein
MQAEWRRGRRLNSACFRFRPIITIRLEPNLCSEKRDKNSVVKSLILVRSGGFSVPFWKWEKIARLRNKTLVLFLLWSVIRNNKRECFAAIYGILKEKVNGYWA